ncbi:MAG: TrkA family potassium uptake protein [Armatimonadetes bacterium]|nr:TrkA family potassium uptake protein [Armatimonadota bacterium]
MYVVVVGGGKVGTYLAKRLLSEDKEVLILEKDPDQHAVLQAQFREIAMLGDGCEVRVQKTAGFQRADVVVAVTGEDEDNLIISQMASRTWGVDRTVARVNDPSHTWLFQQVGVSATVSATDVIYHLIEQEISPGQLIPLAALKMGNIEVVEATLTSRSPSVGRRVKDLELPPKSNIVWMHRGDEGTIVNGETELQAGDLVVALVPTEHEAKLREIL